MTAQITVLISGRGSNLKSLIEQSSKYQSYEIKKVISDHANAPGLEHARKAKIPHESFPRSEFKNKLAQKEAIYAAIESSSPDIIALAGFMQIVAEDFAKKHYGKIINIHPSILPNYPGLNTHERVLENLSTMATPANHGCTVHFVDAGIDTGPIIAQAECEIVAEDTPQSLAARVLTLEHQLYAWSCHQIASERLKLVGRKILFDPEVLKSAKELGFKLRI